MSEELTPPRFPTMLRKMWSGGEVQAWIDENWNRRAQPAAQALPSITEQQSKWGRLYTAANALVVKMGFIGSMQADSTEMESLKDKLHDLDGGEWMPGLMPPAQPAAPSVCSSCDGTGKISGLPCAWCMQSAAPAVSWRDHVEQRLHSWRSTTMNADGDCVSLSDYLNWETMDRLIDFVCDESVGPDATDADAAPSVAPEPVAWTLQSELDAAQTTCSAHLWFTNPRNSAWTALFTREQIAAHPPRAPLTEEHVTAVVRSVQPHLATTSKAWRELAEDCRYWLKAERAVTEAAHGIRGQG